MTELAIRPTSEAAVFASDPTGGRLIAWASAATAAHQLASALVKTTFVPQHFKNNVGDATAAIIAGDELGLSPLASLRAFYVVHGTPALYAKAMVALALSAGHQIWTEKTTDAEVVVCGRRAGTDNIERAAWTNARAVKAGYTSNKKYSSNPQEMLYAKASAEVAKKIAADVLAGIGASVEDLELEQTAEPVAAPTKVQRRPRPAAPATPEPEFDSPAEPEPTDVTDAVELITDPQMRKMQALFSEKGFVGRDDRMDYVTQVMEIPVESSKDLTKDQASQVIEALTALPTVSEDDALDAARQAERP